MWPDHVGQRPWATPSEPEVSTMTEDRVLWIMTWLVIAGMAVAVVVLKLT